MTTLLVVFLVVLALLFWAAYALGGWVMVITCAVIFAVGFVTSSLVNLWMVRS